MWFFFFLGHIYMRLMRCFDKIWSFCIHHVRFNENRFILNLLPVWLCMFSFSHYYIHLKYFFLFHLVLNFILDCMVGQNWQKICLVEKASDGVWREIRPHVSSRLGSQWTYISRILSHNQVYIKLFFIYYYYLFESEREGENKKKYLLIWAIIAYKILIVNIDVYILERIVINV